MKADAKVILDKKMGRRSFLKGSAAAIAAAGMGASLLGSDFASAESVDGASAGQEIVRPGTCRGGCGAGCQMNVHSRDGKIVKVSRRVQEDPHITRVCVKGMTHALRVYEENRLKYPMKRVGDRGSGEWEQISWDEAIATITDTWKEVAKRYGAGANAFLKGSGNMSPDAHHTLRLRSAMGATLIDPAQDRVNYAAFPPALGLGAGQGGSGRRELANSKSQFLWGSNPAEAQSQMFHYNLRARAENGSKLVVIDPNYTTTASKADVFVRAS